MILEVEYAVDQVVDVLRLALVDAMLQDPDADEPIVSTVVPSWADGDVVFLEGAFSLDVLARAIVSTIHVNGGRDE